MNHITIVENILKPITVGELLKQNLDTDEPLYKFFIPSYQRGYRWDQDQVTDLLDDLLEFITTSKNKKDKYCLQPIVVKINDGRYEVLDGQQRLTTIFILLTRLKKNNSDIDLFSLEYDTRPNSAIFLKNIDETPNSDNPDYYYISNAYITINKWLKVARNTRPSIATELFTIIATSVEFIWYEIKSDVNDINHVDAIDVFTRINIGKIPLTNAELVKAVFLSKNNLSLGYASGDFSSTDFSKILTLKQNAIALEWDQMEKVLQDPKVWGFIYSGNTVYETRIDYLLDLRSNKKPGDTNKYSSFKHFYDIVKSIRNDDDEQAKLAQTNTSFIEVEWAKLKEIFDILLEWYHNKTYNHLIGFLIDQKASISTLVNDFKNNDRDKFLIEVKSKIKGLINCPDISVLRYNNGSGDKDKLNKILLLHNVINSLKIDDNNVYFPFEKLKDKLWTLEHIFAQNSEDLKEDDYIDWLSDHVDFFKAITGDEHAANIYNTIISLLARGARKFDKEEFQDCFKKVSGYIQDKIDEIDQANIADEPTSEVEASVAEKEYAWIDDDHSIANLALLDGSINSAIKNSLFDIKRGLILEKDKQGLFVPNETKKVFLKYYTPTPRHLAYWTYNDRKAYITSIRKTLTYLN